MKWRSALGLSLRWPARETAFFLRGDAVWPLDRQPGQSQSTQFYARIGIPF